MSPNRNGKIARLPRDLREELNRRLAGNESGSTLLPWLNELPAVRDLVAQQFNGVAISKQNLSEWRAGGFAEWQLRQDMLAQTSDLAADARDLCVAADHQFSDHLATLLTARYAALLTGWNGEVDEALERRLKVLRGLGREIAELRRCDHRLRQFRLEQEREEQEREKTQQELYALFEKWAENETVREIIYDQRHRAQERIEALRDLYDPSRRKNAPPEDNSHIIKGAGEDADGVMPVQPIPAARNTKDNSGPAAQVPAPGVVEASADGPVKPGQTESNHETDPDLGTGGHEPMNLRKSSSGAEDTGEDGLSRLHAREKSPENTA